MVGNTSTGISIPSSMRPGTQPPVLVATPRVSCALASVTTALDTVQTHSISPRVVPDMTQFAMVTVPQVFTSSPSTTVVAPSVASVITTPVIIPTVPSAGTQLKSDETPKVSVVATTAQPPVSVPKPEVVAVTQPQLTPPTEPSVSGNQVVGPQQVMVQPAAPTIVVRTTTPPKPYSGLTSYKAYRQQFERVCDCNNWNTPLERAKHLIASLEGAAAEAVWGFKVEKDGDYEKIWEMLQRRFGFIDESERAKRNLENRKQGDNESITLFEQGLRALFREAWPQMDPKNQDSEGMLQRLFVNGIRDGALQQYLRLHARGDNFSQTVEKARIFVEANDLGPLSLKKPAVRFAQSPTRQEKESDNSEMYADKILEGLNKVLRAVEQNTEIKNQTKPDPLQNGQNASNGPNRPAVENTSNNNVRNDRGRNFSPTRGRNFSENRDSRSPARQSTNENRNNSNDNRNKNSNSDRNSENDSSRQTNANDGYNAERGRMNNRSPRSNYGGRYNENSRPQGRQWNNNRNGNRENDGSSQNNRPARTGCYVCGTIGCHTWFHQNQRGRLPAETSPRENVRRGIELRDVPPPDANTSVDRRCPICYNFYCVDPNQCVKVMRNRGPARSCSLCYELKCPGPRNYVREG